MKKQRFLISMVSWVVAAHALADSHARLVRPGYEGRDVVTLRLDCLDAAKICRVSRSEGAHPVKSKVVDVRDANKVFANYADAVKNVAPAAVGARPSRAAGLTISFAYAETKRRDHIAPDAAVPRALTLAAMQLEAGILGLLEESKPAK